MTARIGPGSWRDLGPINFAISRIGARATGAHELHLFSTLGRGKGLFLGWLTYSALLMPFGSMRRIDTETIILRVAHLRNNTYELGHHRRIGAKIGLTPDQFEAIFTDTGWDERSAVQLTAITDLVETRAVPNTSWELVAKHYSQRELVEIAFLAT